MAEMVLVLPHASIDMRFSSNMSLSTAILDARAIVLKL